MASASDGTYTLHGTTALPFADAVAKVRETLRDEGFGVVTEIDVQATMREKLGAELEPYLILGACNPTFAHRALEVESELGALLPCNVVVYEQGGETHVSAVDPVAMLGIVGNAGLEPIGAEIRRRVERAVESVWNA